METSDQGPVSKVVDANLLPLVLTVEETAKVLRIGRSACYELVRMRLIPHFRLGKHIRVGRDQLLTWMENGGLEQTKAAPEGLQAVGAATQSGDAYHARSRTGQRLRSV